MHKDGNVGIKDLCRGQQKPKFSEDRTGELWDSSMTLCSLNKLWMVFFLGGEGVKYSGLFAKCKT